MADPILTFDSLTAFQVLITYQNLPSDNEIVFVSSTTGLSFGAPTLGLIGNGSTAIAFPVGIPSGDYILRAQVIETRDFLAQTVAFHITALPASASQTPTDLVNMALARIGYKGRIGSVFDGSDAARKALDIYAQTRDELLRDGNWGFAERNVLMTLLKQANPGGYFPPNSWSSIYPPPPWGFEYLYPSDCLKVRAVKASPLFVQDFDPQPVVYKVINDATLSPAQKVILCNVGSAILVYTAQVTDPATWEADFVEAFLASLGRRLAPVLVGMEAAKMEASDEQVSTQIADTVQG